MEKSNFYSVYWKYPDNKYNDWIYPIIKKVKWIFSRELFYGKRNIKISEEK